MHKIRTQYAEYSSTSDAMKITRSYHTASALAAPSISSTAKILTLNVTTFFYVPPPRRPACTGTRNVCTSLPSRRPPEPTQPHPSPSRAAQLPTSAVVVGPDTAGRSEQRRQPVEGIAPHRHPSQRDGQLGQTGRVGRLTGRHQTHLHLRARAERC